MHLTALRAQGLDWNVTRQPYHRFGVCFDPGREEFVGNRAFYGQEAHGCHRAVEDAQSAPQAPPSLRRSYRKMINARSDQLNDARKVPRRFGPTLPAA
jgi:hypothetical protein